MMLLTILQGLILSLPSFALAAPRGSKPDPQGHYCPIFYKEPPQNCQQIPETFVDFSLEYHNITDPDTAILEDAFNALVVLQRRYFDSDYGTWPEAIDWTAAVAGTVMTGMLTTLTRTLGSVDLGGFIDGKARENLVSSYYAQIVASYFGQDILSIRGQAYDDILWVVLGWVEALRFVSIHENLHYPSQPRRNNTDSEGLRQIMETMPWHGNYWVSQFAHRSRVFWDIASHGWSGKLCHGGMVWNPRLTPYKNAITNELWISASVSMYQYFPGDSFDSPWLATSDMFPGKDPAHLTAAVEGYKWLKDVNMTNEKGLFVDGYHVDSSKPGNTECDLRDEMVYTYNQGVILTGQRGLWTVSGSASYLEEGHDLVQSVINATGWNLRNNTPADDLETYQPDGLPPWHGLGRAGILEERCDASGTCSQDGQTFKGIYFHHLTAFCETLEQAHAEPGYTVDNAAYQRVKSAHAEACTSYVGWVRHNALAALETRDEQGHFGMWWGAGIFKDVLATPESDGIDHSAVNTTDYRNVGTPADSTWGRHDRWLPGSGGLGKIGYKGLFQPNGGEQVLGGGRGTSQRVLTGARADHAGNQREGDGWDDPNSRGRGRQLETQVGGLALLRAYWEMSQPSVPYGRQNNDDNGVK